MIPDRIRFVAGFVIGPGHEALDERVLLRHLQVGQGRFVIAWKECHVSREIEQEGLLLHAGLRHFFQGRLPRRAAMRACACSRRNSPRAFLSSEAFAVCLRDLTQSSRHFAHNCFRATRLL